MVARLGSVITCQRVTRRILLSDAEMNESQLVPWDLKTRKTRVFWRAGGSQREN